VTTSETAVPTLADETLARMAAAVTAASFTDDPTSAPGGGTAGAPGARGFDTSVAVGAAAAGIVDTAIATVEKRRRVRPHQPDPVPLDAEVFDPQTLGDLLEFLRHSRRGMLTAAEIAEEAGMWVQIVGAAWPGEAPDYDAVMIAVELLAAAPVPPAEPATVRSVEPANDLERAVAAVAADENARPQLWQALYESDLVLPVVAYELVRPEGANFQFLAAPVGDTPLILGFGTEERFDALFPEARDLSRVTAPGRDLPKFWPEGHWLMINPGYEPHVVLSPWEIAGLPDGGRSELPPPRAVDIETPAGTEDDERAARLRSLIAGTTGTTTDGTATSGTATTGTATDGTTTTGAPGVVEVHWARVRGRAKAAAGRERANWQDVLVVTAVSATAEAETRAVSAVQAALPAAEFPRAMVVGRQADVAHPFVEAVIDAGRALIADDGGRR
jgi:hypothetical protein